MRPARNCFPEVHPATQYDPPRGLRAVGRASRLASPPPFLLPRTRNPALNRGLRLVFHLREIGACGWHNAQQTKGGLQCEGARKTARHHDFAHSQSQEDHVPGMLAALLLVGLEAGAVPAALESPPPNFHARLCASRMPLFIPWPANGGERCAASPTRKRRPSRQRSAIRAGNVYTRLRRSGVFSRQPAQQFSREFGRGYLRLRSPSCNNELKTPGPIRSGK